MTATADEGLSGEVGGENMMIGTSRRIVLTDRTT